MRLCCQCGNHPVGWREIRCAGCRKDNETNYRTARREAAIRPLVVRQVWNDARGRCEYCNVLVHRKADKYDSRDTIGEIDHVIPAALGGTGERANLKLSCKKCNRRREAEMRPLIRRHIEENKRRTA